MGLEDFGKNLTYYNNGKLKENQQRILDFWIRINQKIDIEIFYHVCFSILCIIHIFIFNVSIVLDDHSRIILNNKETNCSGLDYINANLIHVIKLFIYFIFLFIYNILLILKIETNENQKPRKYIVTQGCLHNTLNDFWSMMWQEDSRVIVMITKLFEKSKV